MIKVVIADDHQLIREGIKKVVNDEMDINVISEAEDGDTLMNILTRVTPDIVILDISMPGKSGLEILKQINELYSDLPVLILSMHSEERFAIRALKSGAYGYLTKSSITKQLVKAIKRIVIEKRKYITPEAAEQLASQIDINTSKDGHNVLSDREFQVFCMIASGKKVKDIAQELSLSSQTIHTYRTRIKKKMNLSSNVEMTRYAIDHDLID